MTTPELQQLHHPDEVQLVWYCGYWDRPLSGIAAYRKRLCWFEVDEQYDGSLGPDEECNYLLYPLNYKEIWQELKWQVLFEQHVGCHNRYRYDIDGTPRRYRGPVSAPSEWHHFFDVFDAVPAEERHPYTNRLPLGSFQLNPPAYHHGRKSHE